MKIEHPSVVQNTPATASKPSTGVSAPPAPSTNASQTARSSGVAVTVSTMARGLEKVGRSGSTADIDTQKVASVKASIQDGTYVVNPEAIADKLLSNAQEMINRNIG